MLKRSQFELCREDSSIKENSYHKIGIVIACNTQLKEGFYFQSLKCGNWF